MTKVVYNACYGGFSLSGTAYRLYCSKKAITPDERELYCDTWHPDIPRHDATLVSVVEELGDVANGPCAALAIDEGSGQYRIGEYDGNEGVVWRNRSGDEWVTP